MELELEISESEDYSEFPAEDSVEQRPLCYNCKRKATTVGLCVKKEEKATQKGKENYLIYNKLEYNQTSRMSAKPPRKPKDATKEQLQDYSH